MQLSIEPLQEGDYEDILCQWWKDWRWTPPSKDFLPDDGLGGFIVYDDGGPVGAGFMYRTNSKAVWCDWIISNINYKNREGRKIALQLLIQTVERLAKDLGYKFIYALIKNKPLINTYLKMGFTEASSYSTEMIKHI